MPVKPLYATQKRPSITPGQPKNSEIRHSEYNGQKSDHYHAKIVGSNDKAIKRMNPTKRLPTKRLFPGLQNG